MFPRIEPSAASDPLAHWCQSFAALGVTVLAQATLVLLVGLAVGWTLERRGAAPLLRATTYRATLAGVAAVLLLAPLASARPAALTIPLPGLPQNLLLRFAAPVPEAGKWGSYPLPRRVVLVATQPTGRGVATAYVAAAGVYLGGVLLSLAGVAAGGLYLRRLVTAGEVLADDSPLVRSLHGLCADRGLVDRRRLPCVVVAPDGADAPFLADARPLLPRPTLFVPTEARSWSESMARAILSHETAHLLRRDGAWLLFGRVLSALLWVHPLLYLLRRRLEEATEEACDAQALSEGACDAATLARCLLELAEHRAAAGHPKCSPLLAVGRAAAATAGALSASSPRFRSTLGRRVARILSEERSRPAPVLTVRASAALLAGAVSVPLLALGGVRAEATAPRTVEMRQFVRTALFTPAPLPDVSAAPHRITVLRVERRVPEGAVAWRRQFRIPAGAGAAPPLVIPISGEGVPAHE